MCTILFDPGSTFSYISIKGSLGLDLDCDTLNSLIYVSSLVGDSMVVTYVYHNCSIL